MEAFSTGDTILFSNSLHMGRIPMLRHFQHIGSWNINAGLDATKTHDASIHPLPNQRSAIFYGWPFYFFSDELDMVDPEFIGTVLELAFSSGIADRAVQRMVDQQEFQSLKSHFFDALRPGMDYHPLDHRCRTRGHGHFRSFDIDQTDTAGLEQA
jgi:hypothetical protein